MTAAGPDLARLLTVADVHEAALELLPKGVADFLDGGAEAERSLLANERSFESVLLQPRILRDVTSVSTQTKVIGGEIALPVLLGPAGAHRLFHPDGELAYARAAAAFGTGMAVSTSASVPLEEVASVGPAVRWFQVYCYRDRSVTAHLMERAREAGYRAICLTVDAPRHGRRLRNLRNGFNIPPEVQRMNFADLDAKLASHGGDLADRIRETHDASLTWNDLEWIATTSGLPLILKGVLHPDDARMAAELGVDGIVVSNHGGRQLDGTVTPISVLPEIRDAAGDGVQLYLDGGVRRGSDIAKALCLGARAVLIARPYIWGLAAGGEAGVRHVLSILKTELELTMALVGAGSVGDLSRTHCRKVLGSLVEVD